MEAPETAIVAPDTSGADLIRELRTAALDHSTPAQPIVLFGLPRWCALRLGRARAQELGKTLKLAHAEALREDVKREQPHCLLWLPIDGHRHGGVILFCHRGYGAGVLVGWRYRTPIGWPRSYTEFPDALCLWRTDQERWIANEDEVRANMDALLQEIAKTTRKTPACVLPSPALLAIIQGSAEQEQAEEVLAEADEPKIVTEHIHPPIPDRSNDWLAYFDGQEEGLRGFGPTEEAAIADLKQQVEDTVQPICPECCHSLDSCCDADVCADMGAKG